MISFTSPSIHTLDSPKASVVGPVNLPLPQDPLLFPLDADWVTMHHDKGQFSRSVASWMERLFEKRLQDGESSEELLLQCWIMSFSGGGHGGGGHGLSNGEILRRLHPDSTRIFIDPELAKPTLSRLEQVFFDASTSWTPPTSVNLRGWSKSRSDQSVQDASRLKFAWISHLCRRTAELGLPEMLRRCCKPGTKWTDILDTPSEFQLFLQPWIAHKSLSNVALSFIIFALHDTGVHSSSPVPLAELMTFACVTYSPKKFQDSVACLCPDPLTIARVSGTAVRTAILTTCEKYIAIKQRIVSFEHERLASQQIQSPPTFDTPSDDVNIGNPCDCHDDDDDDDYDDDYDDKEHFSHELLLLQSEADDINTRLFRALSALSHLAKRYQNAFKVTPHLTQSYFQSTLGCPLGSHEARPCAEQIILAFSSSIVSPRCALALSNYALGLAQCARDDGHPLEFSPTVCSVVWESHHNFFRNQRISDHSKNFASRHLALTLNYPHREGEKKSLSLAPSDTVAHIELGELSRYVPDHLGEDDHGELPIACVGKPRL